MAREWAKSCQGSIVCRGLYHAASMLLVCSLAGPAIAAPRSKAHKPIPRASPGTWVHDGDYPVMAASKEQSGAAAFTLMIDVEGFVENCAITQSTGTAILDETTCSLLKARAYFLPAANDAGKPVPGSYTGRITWRLPGTQDGKASPEEAEEMAAIEEMTKQIEDARKRFESFTSEISFTVEADGSMSDCEQRFEGAAAGRFTPFRCKDMPRVGLPFLDEEGKAVARRMTMRYAVSLDDPPAEAVEDAAPGAPAKAPVPSN